MGAPGPIRLSFVLLALLLAATLASMAPTDCGCRFDIHRGAAFHPIFDHPHPGVPAGDDNLRGRPSTTQIGTGAVATALGGTLLLGFLHAVLLPFALPRRVIGVLVPGRAILPTSHHLPPPAPPPRYR